VNAPARVALSPRDAELFRLRRRVAALEAALDEAHLRIEELLQPGEELAAMLARFPELKLTARQAALVAVMWRKRGEVLRQSTCAAAVAGGAEVIARLADKYGETLQAEGLRGGTSVVQIYANAETGAWTVLDVGVSGLACMISAGEAWSGPLPQQPAGDDL
jgi:hypothetical protein